MVTPIAAQIFDPQATSAIGDGTYLSFAGETDPDVTTANQGEDEPVMPPTTHRSSVVQARVKIEPRSEATFDHFFPKLSVRMIRQPNESFARPTHSVRAQFSDVSADHVTVERPVRAVHVVPPSAVT